MITFPCPGCGQVLKVKEEAAGKTGKCPRCGAACQAPAVTLAAPAPSAPAPPDATQLNPSPGADSAATQAYEGSKATAPRGRGADTCANDNTAGLCGSQGPSLDFLAPAEASG
jgi:hypothetical protein